MSDAIPFFTLADPELCTTPHREKNRDLLDRLQADINPKSDVIIPQVVSFMAFLSSLKIPKPPHPPPPMENFSIENSKAFFDLSQRYRESLDAHSFRKSIDKVKYLSTKEILERLPRAFELGGANSESITRAAGDLLFQSAPSNRTQSSSPQVCLLQQQQQQQEQQQQTRRQSSPRDTRDRVSYLERLFPEETNEIEEEDDEGYSLKRRRV